MAVLDHGELVVQGTTVEVQAHPAARELYPGSSAGAPGGGGAGTRDAGSGAP